MVGPQTLNLAIGVRVPASQPFIPSYYLLAAPSHQRQAIASHGGNPMIQVNNKPHHRSGCNFKHHAFDHFRIEEHLTLRSSHFGIFKEP